jgi:hypothetical protein
MTPIEKVFMLDIKSNLDDALKERFMSRDSQEYLFSMEVMRR